MSNKRSNRIRFIISMFITLSVFFFSYIFFYWTYLNSEFLSSNESRYKETSYSLASIFQNRLNFLEHDIEGLSEYFSSNEVVYEDFEKEFMQRASQILRKEDTYKGVFFIYEPSYSSFYLHINNLTDYFDAENRMNIYLNKNDYGGLRLSNYFDYANEQIVEVYDELIELPSKQIIFPVSRDGEKVMVFLFPVYKNARTIGILGLEMKTTYFQDNLKMLYDKDRNTESYLVSSDGNIVAMSPLLNSTFLGLKFKDIFDNIPSGNIVSRKDTIIYMDNRVLIETPVQTINTSYPWQLKLIFHKRVFRSFTLKIILLNLSLATLALLALIIVLNYLFKTFNFEMKNLLAYGQRLERGLLTKDFRKYSTREFEELNSYFNKITDFELKLSEYIELIRKKDYSERMPMRSNGDHLVEKLNMMVERLAKSRAEAENQALEVEQRNWGRQALAEFANILAATDKSLEELSADTLRKFSDIFGQMIGAIYIREEIKDSEYRLNMVSAYALNHERKIQKIVQYGEGFVGATAIEQKPLFVEKVPENYLDISTGLGRAKPNLLVFVPLIYEQNTVGVLELATLKDLSEYEKQFIISVSENIAISLAGVLVNRRTERLLEQSKQQGHILQSREEELQRNIIELKELQEQAEKTNIKLEAITQNIDFHFYALTLDVKERILDVNSFFSEDFKVEQVVLIGKQFDKISSLADDKEYYFHFWNDLKKGIVRKEHEMFIFSETKRHVISFYTPIKDNRTLEIASIFVFAIDVSSYEDIRQQLNIARFEADKLAQRNKTDLAEVKELNQKFRVAHKDLLGIIEAIDKRIMRVEYTLDGKLISANSSFYTMMGYTVGEDIEGISDKLANNLEIRERWLRVLNGQINEVLTEVKSKSGKVYWWNIIDIPIVSRDGKVVKIMSIAIDLTKEKLSEIKVREEMTAEAIHRKKLQQKLAETETKVNILSEENRVKEELIRKLKDDIKRLRN